MKGASHCCEYSRMLQFTMVAKSSVFHYISHTKSKTIEKPCTENHHRRHIRNSTSKDLIKPFYPFILENVSRNLDLIFIHHMHSEQRFHQNLLKFIHLTIITMLTMLTPKFYSIPINAQKQANGANGKHLIFKTEIINEIIILFAILCASENSWRLWHKFFPKSTTLE